MVDKNVISSRVEQIDKGIEKLSTYKDLSYEEFIKNWKDQDIIEYNLFQLVNHMIDLMEHIVVDEDYGLPATAYEAAEILKKEKVLDEKDLIGIKKMIGFRNVVGHEYIKLDKLIVYAILENNLGDIKSIVSKIVKNFLN